MERSYFYDSYPDDPREYQQDALAAFFAQIIGNGVSNAPNLSNGEVTATNSMTVQLGPMWAFANGYGYNNTAALNLTHDTADPSYDRIDRIVTRYDSSPQVRWNKAYVKKGTPSDNPVPPDLQRDTLVYELSVSQVRVTAGKSFIEQSQITDERANPNVCGYIPLHNIYRGLTIDENGMVTMPRQSFVKTENQANISFPENVRTALPFGEVLEDKQGELISDTMFRPKANGVFNVWAEVGLPQSSFPNGLDGHIYVYVNGKESFPLEARVLNTSNDNFFIASGFDSFNQGDEVEFRFIHYNTGESISSNLLRVRIAKMA
ncbi:hypothetical protein MUO14_24135 [Halobacillus shinanisalinarum]|uniref:Uncharacterized protein n=1 Tax=Halobacillus shinanisalinarum TaxID=2932258 RepID=A0ABY4GZS9_9BACI|nr:hypothetical protein [Halobacillus shinanisalinarum]UOQ93420.1 hypothetical protein MUO14_24135 [Halobacillus shinanisalinarum]